MVACARNAASAAFAERTSAAIVIEPLVSTMTPLLYVNARALDP